MEFELSISSQLNNINIVRSFLDEIFLKFCLDRKYFNRIFLGLSEAVCNCIVHGNALDIDKKVVIKVSYSSGSLFFEIKDEGNGFCFANLSDPTSVDNLKKENGRGIFLIRQTADDVKFDEGGSKVLIRYKLAE